MNYSTVLTAFLLLLTTSALFTSCKKDDQSVKYAAACDRCDVWYVTGDNVELGVAVRGSWNVFVVDTLTTPTDTTYVMDSTYVFGSWSASAQIEHDAKPILRARNNDGSASTSITLTVDGSVTTASTSSSMAIVNL